MNKDEKSKIKYRMKRLARKFCRRNHVYESFDGSVGDLIKKSYLSAYFQCLHENKNKTTELEKENVELKEGNKELRKLVQQIEQRGLEVQEDLLKEKEQLKKDNAELRGRHIEIIEVFDSASSGDDFEMAESAREIMEILNIPCYRHGKVVSKLTKAKYIIKELLDFDFLPENEIKKQAEQFLSEE